MNGFYPPLGYVHVTVDTKSGKYTTNNGVLEFSWNREYNLTGPVRGQWNLTLAANSVTDVDWAGVSQIEITTCESQLHLTVKGIVTSLEMEVVEMDCPIVRLGGMVTGLTASNMIGKEFNEVTNKPQSKDHAIVGGNSQNASDDMRETTDTFRFLQVD